VDRSRSSSDVRRAAVTACRDLRAGETIDEVVHRILVDAGFDQSGAEAIVAAALRTWCPERNSGYRTRFDRNVAQAQELIRQAWGRHRVRSRRARQPSSCASILLIIRRPVGWP
jgi:Protein of unknown function (DUF732)